MNSRMKCMKYLVAMKSNHNDKCVPPDKLFSQSTMSRGPITVLYTLLHGAKFKGQHSGDWYGVKENFPTHQQKSNTCWCVCFFYYL